MFRPARRRLYLLLAISAAGLPMGALTQPPTPRTDRFGDPLPDGALLRLGTTRLRATAAGVAFSSDGKTILTATGVHGLVRCDAATGRLRDEVALPGAPGMRSWFSPDGKLLAIGEEDGLAFWDTANGKRLRLLPCRVAQIGPIAFGPGVIATGEFNGKEGQITLWDLATGQTRPVSALPSYANALTFDRTGKRLFAAVDNHSLRCWDVATRKQLWENDHWASHIALSPDGALLAADSYLGREPATLWDAATGKRVATLGKEKVAASQVAFAPDGKTLALATWTNGVLLWDVGGRTLRQRITVHDPHLAFAPDSHSIVTAGRMLQRWDIETGKPLYADTRNLGHVGAVDTVAFAPDGRALASSGEDNTVRLWDLADGRFRMLRTDAPGGRVRGVITGGGRHVGTAVPLEFTPDGQFLLTDAAGGALVLTDVASGNEARRFLLPEVTGGTVSPVAVRLTADGKQVRMLGQAMIMFGSSLEIGPRPQPVRAWDLRDGREVLTTSVLSNHADAAVFSPDGRLLVQADLRTVHDLHTGSQWSLFTRPGTAGMPVVFSGDGRLVALADPGLLNGPTVAIQVFEVLTGRRVARMPADVGCTRALGFSADGRLLAAAGHDALHVWDSIRGTRVLHLSAKGRLTQWHGAGFATALDFSPGGKALATGHADGTIHLWDLAPAWHALAVPEPKMDPATRWTDLAAADASVAYAAINRLAAAPGPALALLKQHLHPMKVDPTWLAQRLRDLGDDDFDKREAAMRALKPVVEPVESELRRAMAKPASLEVRRRLEQLLATLRNAPLTSDDLRQLRAVAVLERIASQPAQALLRELADGAPDAQLTRGARAALARLARKAKAVR